MFPTLMLSTFSTVLVAAMLGTPLPGAHATPARVLADSLPFDTTQVVMTQHDFTQLTTFLESMGSEWRQPQLQALMKTHVVQYPLELGKVALPANAKLPPGIETGAMVAIPNYVLIADSVPALAQRLATAKLTAARYMQLCRTLNNAWVTDYIDLLTHDWKGQYADSNTVIGKNVAFIRAHDIRFRNMVAGQLDVTWLSPNNSYELNP